MKDRRIATIIPKYGELNRLYKTIIERGFLYFDEQESITNFYRGAKDVGELELSVVELMISADKSISSVLLKSLKKEIEANRLLYLANRVFLDNLDTEKVCFAYAKRFDRQIDNQMTVVREYSKDLREVNNSLEAMAYKEHTQDEEDLLQRKYDQYKKEYEEQRAKLNNWYTLQKKAAEEALKCVTNLFSSINDLNEKISLIIEKYLIQEETVEIQEETETPSLVTYFPERLTSSLYKICNGEQFEEISEIYFHANLNLHPCEKQLRVRAKEKIRVCYLIYLLGERLSKDQREEWKDAILQQLEIDTSYYKSKYKEPVSDFPSDSNQKFAEEMANIF
ncbi:MAG: hypothetical protein E7097_11905 [Bacteroides sp.]|nr:hypothetical protein [Bacteroides sp.]